MYREMGMDFWLEQAELMNSGGANNGFSRLPSQS